MDSGSIVVLDFGKTLSKVSLWSRNGRCLARETKANSPQPATPYAALDVAETARWVIETLAGFAAYPVEAIVPVAHGAAVAGIRDGEGLAFAPLDYEWPIPTEILADYRATRDPFSVTGSPALPCGLNIGSQLHYLETINSLEGVTLMPLAQYWAWLLSGVAVSEVTSLGCHTDLWAPVANDFSPLAKARGWAARFAPLAKASDVIGTLQPELARPMGFSPNVQIYAGLHDSNAALIAARGFPEVSGAEVTALSTGTWFIAMRSPRDPTDLAALPGDRDCLVNIDPLGWPVPSARFMGGREIELLGARIDHGGTVGLADVLNSGAMVLPNHAAGCGPFPNLVGRWINFPSDADEQIAAVALYAALMADTALELIGARERLVIEGRFARSEIFARALAALRPGTQVFAIDEEADVSFGALRLLYPDLVPHQALTPVEPLDCDLAAYREEWLNDIEVFS